MKKSFLYFICMVSAMGGLLFGYDWVVIGGAKPFYESFFGIENDATMQGLAMTTALIGCLVGAMVAGAAADRWGRRTTTYTTTWAWHTQPSPWPMPASANTTSSRHKPAS